MIEPSPIKTVGLIILAIVTIVGGWYTEGYWQAIFIEFGLGLAIFVALEIFMVGEIYWQIPTFGPLIWAWFVDNALWQAILITIGSTYMLYSITLRLNVEQYVPPYVEDLAPRGPYRPEIEEFNHPGQVRRVTLTGFALHEFEEFQRAKKREYNERYREDNLRRSLDVLLGHTTPHYPEREPKPGQEAEDSDSKDST